MIPFCYSIKTVRASHDRILLDCLLIVLGVLLLQIFFESHLWQERDSSKKLQLVCADDHLLVKEAQGNEVISTPEKSESGSCAQGNLLFFHQKIPVNTATINDLLVIPGIGRKTAEKILEYRKKNGKFIDESDLRTVPGIGAAKSKKIARFLTFTD